MLGVKNHFYHSRTTLMFKIRRLWGLKFKVDLTLRHIWFLQFSINLCDMSQHLLHQLNAAFLLIVKESQSPIYNIKLQILLVICMMLIQYVWVGSVFFGFSLGVAYLRIEKQIHN